MSPDGVILRGTSGSSGRYMNYGIGSQQPILVDFNDPDIMHTKGNHALIVGVAMVLIGGASGVGGTIALI